MTINCKFSLPGLIINIAVRRADSESKDHMHVRPCKVNLLFLIPAYMYIKPPCVLLIFRFQLNDVIKPEQLTILGVWSRRSSLKVRIDVENRLNAHVSASTKNSWSARIINSCCDSYWKWSRIIIGVAVSAC